MTKHTNCPIALGAGTAIGLDAYWHEGLTHRRRYRCDQCCNRRWLPLLRPVQLYHTTPALIYSPQETHVYTAIELYYSIQLVGDTCSPAVASPNTKRTLLTK
ncbi:hypothetical protein FIBSPDRAFT_851565 [Athelia psychrophila]|uniref:Uncharacterized protein n=1 Tax=Athelia psychrophila TaxID=1759441 RepID=A0A166SA21_9AGAM|nr:hypothetical protein FIBSPDRAFT_851565 [Fibularhizoctonia sp. CBS 109695]